MEPTQVTHKAKTVARTVFQSAIGLCVILPLIVQAATNNADPATYAAWIVVALTISGAVTRVMAVRQVNDWLNTYFPWLGASDE